MTALQSHDTPILRRGLEASDPKKREVPTSTFHFSWRSDYLPDVDWDLLWESILCLGVSWLQGGCGAKPNWSQTGPQELSHEASGQRMAVWATAGSLSLRSGPGPPFHSFGSLFSEEKKMG